MRNTPPWGQRSTVGRFLAAATLVVSVGVAGACASPGSSAAQATTGPAVIRLAYDPARLDSLPLEVAQAKGYFRAEGVDVRLVPSTGGASTDVAELAKGAVDVLEARPTPELIDQLARLPTVKLIASMVSARPGRAPSAELLVRADEASRIRALTDLRGRTVATGAPDSAAALTLGAALRSAGLAPGTNVTVTYHPEGSAALAGLLQSRAADVVSLPPAEAGPAVAQGSGIVWKTSTDLAPWYQASFLTVTTPYLLAHRPSLAKLVAAYLKAAREVDATNGTWTQPLLTTYARAANASPDAVKALGGVPYFDPNGTVSVDGLRQDQDIWMRMGQLGKKLAVPLLPDPSVPTSAARLLGSAA